MKFMTIGNLARESNVKIDTVRYYERLGLVMPQSRSRAGYRLYTDSDARKIRFIKRSQGLGFSLAEIKRLLEFGTSESATAADVLKLTEFKIAEQKEKIAQLRKVRAALKKVAERCDGNGSVEECPIFQFLKDVP